MKLENKINLDDIIKLSHMEVINDLIKESADVLTKGGVQSKIDPENVAEVISEQYKRLFIKEFTKRYYDTISDKFEIVDRLEEIVEQLEASRL
ncbi:hypothetical protein ACFSKI_19215 [Pseudogracilibacillus auburnensis]|uniref:Uncharacterized protein n=1 Tax=Pseudogracilibacillus auburnensis TaxID=1494959 RepID=A0A2V3W6R2_9BACI|nr:hypothetical protein [Pseudogracilibacillus auburnensis]PXW88828.1 hypothetical protein DFR56_103334 [Pseudogracilibacillus auburnensis]